MVSKVLLVEISFIPGYVLKLVFTWVCGNIYLGMWTAMEEFDSACHCATDSKPYMTYPAVQSIKCLTFKHVKQCVINIKQC